MKHLYLDTETLPSNNAALIAAIRSAIKAPGQYKKPESIREWMDANAEGAVREELAKTALDGLYGSICVIGWAIDGGPVHTVWAQAAQDERSILNSFCETLKEQSVEPPSPYPQKLMPVGHYVEFDLRFIFQRAVRYDIQIPACIRGAFDLDRNRYEVADTMRLWAGWKGTVKLKDLARELLGDVNTDIDGTDVSQVWATDPARVVEHCRQDVERVRALHRRMWGVLA